MRIKFCLICIFLFVTSTIKAQLNTLFQEAVIKENSAMYKEASILYDRVLFEGEEEKKIVQCIFGKLRCLKRLYAFSDAIAFIKSNLVLVKSDSLRCKLYEEWILNCYLVNDLDQCMNLIQQTKILYPTLYNSDWLIAMNILCLNEKYKWAEAKQVYIDWMKMHHKDTLEIIHEYKNAPKLKSENKAGWLSTFIPGAGQFYSGKPLEALTSVIIQGTGIYFGVISYQQQYYLSAWLVGGGIFGSFHFGSTRRSEELVKQYNLKVSAIFNTKIREKIIGLLKNSTL